MDPFWIRETYNKYLVPVTLRMCGPVTACDRASAPALLAFPACKRCDACRPRQRVLGPCLPNYIITTEHSHAYFVKVINGTVPLKPEF